MIEPFDFDLDRFGQKTATVRPYFYRGYPQLLYEEELSEKSVTLSDDEKWGIIYGGLRVPRTALDDLIIIGEVDKWAHISQQVTHIIKTISHFLPQ